MYQKKLKLSDKMPLGKYKKEFGYTIREVIDNAGPLSMNWYVDNIDWFTLDEEAYDYFLNGLEEDFQLRYSESLGRHV